MAPNQFLHRTNRRLIHRLPSELSVWVVADWGIRSSSPVPSGTDMRWTAANSPSPLPPLAYDTIATGFAKLIVEPTLKLPLHVRPIHLRTRLATWEVGWLLSTVHWQVFDWAATAASVTDVYFVDRDCLTSEYANRATCQQTAFSGRQFFTHLVPSTHQHSFVSILQKCWR
jgi:hypothetical protein